MRLETAVSTVIGMAIGNFIWAGLTTKDWELALDRTLFQIAAVTVYCFNARHVA